MRGVGLVEVLLSLVLLSVGLLGLTKLHVFVEQQSNFAQQSITALAMAEAQLEAFRTRGASGGTYAPIAYDDITTGQQTHGMFQIDWRVTELDVGTSPLEESAQNEAKKIVISVSWPDRFCLDCSEPSHHLSLTTIISQYSEFD
ncbi:type IV pilin [Vibrio sp. SM6]|uniref:Type IV pilin n=2 Tax=Vibrio agarilyticus TaxID=2726741 RepID=A0A7X8TSP5_9VIBR|nr:type IV pilin [Vibrio agarilyticus]